MRALTFGECVVVVGVGVGVAATAVAAVGDDVAVDAAVDADAAFDDVARRALVFGDTFVGGVCDGDLALCDSDACAPAAAAAERVDVAELDSCARGGDFDSDASVVVACDEFDNCPRDGDLDSVDSVVADDDDDDDGGGGGVPLDATTTAPAFDVEAVGSATIVVAVDVDAMLLLLLLLVVLVVVFAVPTTADAGIVAATIAAAAMRCGSLRTSSYTSSAQRETTSAIETSQSRHRSRHVC